MIERQDREEGEEFIVQEDVIRDGLECLEPRGRTERAEDSILAGLGMMMTEPVSPQVKGRIDRSRLVIFGAHRIEILSKELQQFWRIVILFP